MAAHFTRILHLQVQVLVVQSQTVLPRCFVLTAFDGAVILYPTVSDGLVDLNLVYERGLEVALVTTKRSLVGMYQKVTLFFPSWNCDFTNWTRISYFGMLSSQVCGQVFFHSRCEITAFKITFKDCRLLCAFVKHVNC